MLQTWATGWCEGVGQCKSTRIANGIDGEINERQRIVLLLTSNADTTIQIGATDQIGQWQDAE